MHQKVDTQIIAYKLCDKNITPIITKAKTIKKNYKLNRNRIVQQLHILKKLIN